MVPCYKLAECACACVFDGGRVGNLASSQQSPVSSQESLRALQLPSALDWTRTDIYAYQDLNGMLSKAAGLVRTVHICTAQRDIAADRRNGSEPVSQ